MTTDAVSQAATHSDRDETTRRVFRSISVAIFWSAVYFSVSLLITYLLTRSVSSHRDEVFIALCAGVLALLGTSKLVADTYLNRVLAAFIDFIFVIGAIYVVSVSLTT